MKMTTFRYLISFRNASTNEKLTRIGVVNATETTSEKINVSFVLFYHFSLVDTDSVLLFKHIT